MSDFQRMTPKLHQTEVSVQVYNNQTVRELIAIEPGVKVILDLAADPNPRANRWISYEACKRLYNRLEEHNPVICDGRYYNTMIWAVDALLSISDGEDMMDSDQLLDEEGA